MSTEIENLTAADFKKLVKTHSLRSEKMIEACRLVFVEGETRRAASIAAGVDYASLHRTIRKMQGLCPHCGQPLPREAKD
jgi:hypothetical protein